MVWFETNKYSFMRMVKGAKEVRFRYDGTGNDPYNPCGTVKKQATYEFYVIIDGIEKLIVYKNHRRSHEVVKEQLEKRYGYWVKLILNSPTPPKLNKKDSYGGL